MSLDTRVSARILDILIGAFLIALGLRLLRLEKDHHDLSEAWRQGLQHDLDREISRAERAEREATVWREIRGEPGLREV